MTGKRQVYSSEIYQESDIKHLKLSIPGKMYKKVIQDGKEFDAKALHNSIYYEA